MQHSSMGGSPAFRGNVVDFVGYGSANCSEGSPTGVLANATAALRKNNGAAIKSVSARFVVLCVDIGMFKECHGGDRRSQV